MEAILLGAILAAALYVGKHHASSPSPSPISPGGSPPAPGPAGPLGPGVYPAGTPGAIPVVLYVQGGDGDAVLYATPGSYAGPDPPKTQTVWYGPGTRVTFQAKVVPFLPLGVSFTAFDHFEGPGGAQTRQNPFSQVITATGYVRAVFSWLGSSSG